MVDQSLMTLKVRSYLGALSRNACDMLIRNLEASRERGDTDPQVELILDAARPLLRKRAGNDQPRAHRKNLLKRAIFLPLEPYLITEELPRKLPGRIRRARLDAMWTWVERDVMPDSIAEAQTLLAQSDYDPDVVGRTAQKLREVVVAAIGDVLEEARGPGVAHQRVAYRVGGEDVLSELGDIHGILKADAVLEGFATNLPPVITRRSFATREASKTRAQVIDALKLVVDDHPGHVGWLAAILLWRCDDPALLARIAGAATGLAQPQAIHSGPYAEMVEIALSELRRYVLMAQEAVTDAAAEEPAHGVEWQSEAVVVAVSRYHDQFREMRTGIDLREVSEWRQELERINRDMADVICGQISEAHRHIHKALQVPREAEEGGFGPDVAAAATSYRALRVLYIACKSPDMLAVSETVTKARRAIEQVLDIASRSLVDELRAAVGARREALKAALDRAIAYAAIVFGDDYVEVLKKRRTAVIGEERRPLAS
ncbi:hypothetical protein C8N35_110116 [Breoghania corrubedonensis]|uniref:Uncharacterized protein n=1 Tax=Breoghania corrubedonensis TaxID=665038 RepID=A0A2T5V1K7_9HYPH|nr:hypothetical protein [Breoghania corrubedonensis]PTW57637.1 hypothetical protein C8N35_110116 [Breoghania corrubedonensis]